MSIVFCSYQKRNKIFFGIRTNAYHALSIYSALCNAKRKYKKRKEFFSNRLHFNLHIFYVLFPFPQTQQCSFEQKIEFHKLKSCYICSRSFFERGIFRLFKLLSFSVETQRNCEMAVGLFQEFLDHFSGKTFCWKDIHRLSTSVD